MRLARFLATLALIAGAALFFSFAAERAGHQQAASAASGTLNVAPGLPTSSTLREDAGVGNEPGSGAATHPVTREAVRWQPLQWWMRQALCIHRHESVDWHRAGVDWRGRPSNYFGGYQFLLSTWRRTGGTRLPSDWAPHEQTYRAHVLWDMQDGRRGNGRGDWSEFGTARACGLR